MKWLVCMPRSKPWRAFVASYLITQSMGEWDDEEEDGEMCSQSDCEKSNSTGEYTGELTSTYVAHALVRNASLLSVDKLTSVQVIIIYIPN